jgi:hypothetical protein
VAEGSAVVFTVALSNASESEVTVDYETFIGADFHGGAVERERIGGDGGLRDLYRG